MDSRGVLTVSYLSVGTVTWTDVVVTQPQQAGPPGGGGGGGRRLLAPPDAQTCTDGPVPTCRSMVLPPKGEASDLLTSHLVSLHPRTPSGHFRTRLDEMSAR